MFTEKVARRDDPFSNGNMLGIMMFIIVIQKYIVESVLSYMMDGETFFDQKLLVTFR